MIGDGAGDDACGATGIDAGLGRVLDGATPKLVWLWRGSKLGCGPGAKERVE
jgi:hypothetical protein